MLPTDKGGGGQKTGGREDWRQEGINFSKDLASNPSKPPADYYKKEKGERKRRKETNHKKIILFLFFFKWP